jgi:hypothetical protein
LGLIFCYISKTVPNMIRCYARKLPQDIGAMQIVETAESKQFDCVHETKKPRKIEPFVADLI